MYLTRHDSPTGPRWALNGEYLAPGFRLDFLLSMNRTSALDTLAALERGDHAADPLLPPIEAHQEIWASGVTYLRSREARKAESSVGDVYEKVYDAKRPELFFKALGWRARTHNQTVRIRRDSTWDVPEPELTLVANRYGEILGFCAGNDMSSRSIEGENPLYLPQAKTYRDSCAIGPGLMLSNSPLTDSIRIAIEIMRGDEQMYAAETPISAMKRTPQELIDWLFKELDFPYGVLLMTGTALVPGDDFTLQIGDRVSIRVGDLLMENEIA